MVEFQILRGKEEDLPKKLTDGYMYICIDTGSLYVDCFENNFLKRIKLNSWDTIQDKPTFNLEKHASSHASNGSDPISPESIGAIPSNLIGQINGIASLNDQGLVPISQLPSPIKQVNIVNDIAERDAIEAPFSTLQVYVKDASADPTVSSGGAWYLYDGSTWIKTGEAESMDVITDWANITGKPATFAPTAHIQDITTITGLEERLANIESSIRLIGSKLDSINGEII